jgi:Tol biopolymer transport system component
VDLAGDSVPLTETFSSATGLAWSPSGDEIWFTAGRAGNIKPLLAVDLSGRQRMIDGAPADLSLQDVSPGGAILLTRNTSRRGMVGVAPGDPVERDLSWLDWARPGALSRDGKWILFDEQGQGGGPEYSVYLRGTDGSPAVRLGSGVSVALSPDGRWALSIPVARPDRLVFLPRGVGAPRTVAVAGFVLTVARWLPDGKRFILLGREGAGALRLYVLDSEGATPRQLTPDVPRAPFAISPDGEVVAIATSPDDLVRLFPIAGGEPRLVPGAEPEDVVLGWSNDGRSLFVARRAELPFRIQRLDLSTGRKTPWKELMPDDRAGLLDIGFINLSADGRSYVYSYRKMLSTLYLVEGLE